MKQIQAITGHKTLAEVERYTRKADQVRLARQAMEIQQTADDRFATSAKIVNILERDYARCGSKKTGKPVDFAALTTFARERQQFR